VEPEPETLDSILLGEGKCGCENRGERWFLCQWHDGFEVGLEVGQRRTPPEGDLA